MSKLILVPTPIDEIRQLEPSTKDFLEKNWQNFQILVEDPKPARRRWLRFGLPREAIEHFIHYNEHSRGELLPQITSAIKRGKAACLMSDCGMPAFCDPGQELVEECHRRGIPVASTGSDNSIALALAMSGFPHDRFRFIGFPKQKGAERQWALEEFVGWHETTILMETPYRLERLLKELSEINLPKGKEFCLALGLGMDEEMVIRGSLDVISKKIDAKSKVPFVLLCG